VNSNIPWICAFDGEKRWIRIYRGYVPPKGSGTLYTVDMCLRRETVDHTLRSAVLASITVGKLRISFDHCEAIRLRESVTPIYVTKLRIASYLQHIWLWLATERGARGIWRLRFPKGSVGISGVIWLVISASIRR